VCWSTESATIIAILSKFLICSSIFWWCWCQLHNVSWECIQMLAESRTLFHPEAPPHSSLCQCLYTYSNIYRRICCVLHLRSLVFHNLVTASITPQVYFLNLYQFCVIITMWHSWPHITTVHTIKLLILE
jgi:hypothetical protein